MYVLTPLCCNYRMNVPNVALMELDEYHLNYAEKIDGWMPLCYYCHTVISMLLLQYIFMDGSYFQRSYNYNILGLVFMNINEMC